MENDKTDWSYVYFGSYPQSEVTGAALTKAITGAAYDANGDAWVDGVKYRRISKNDTNYDGHFGDSAYRYFKWERIRWKVLQNDGSTLFVLADLGLDCVADVDDYGCVTCNDVDDTDYAVVPALHLDFSFDLWSMTDNGGSGDGGGEGRQREISLLQDYGSLENYLQTGQREKQREEPLNIL